MDSHERYRSIDWRDSMKLQRCWLQWGEAPAFVMPVFILTFFCARWQDIKIPPFCKHKLTLEKNERGERGLEASNLRKAKKPLTAWRKRAREESERVREVENVWGSSDGLTYIWCPAGNHSLLISLPLLPLSLWPNAWWAPNCPCGCWIGPSTFEQCTHARTDHSRYLSTHTPRHQKSQFFQTRGFIFW